MVRDPYGVLGVTRSSTKEEVKKAFRKLAMVHHPDRGGNEAKFKEITESYSIIQKDLEGGSFSGGIGGFAYDPASQWYKAPSAQYGYGWTRPKHYNENMQFTKETIDRLFEQMQSSDIGGFQSEFQSATNKTATAEAIKNMKMDADRIAKMMRDVNIKYGNR